MSDKPKPVAKPVHCGDCGWHGKRVIPDLTAFQPKRCPSCGSRNIYVTPKY